MGPGAGGHHTGSARGSVGVTELCCDLHSRIPAGGTMKPQPTCTSPPSTPIFLAANLEKGKKTHVAAISPYCQGGSDPPTEPPLSVPPSSHLGGQANATHGPSSAGSLASRRDASGLGSSHRPAGTKVQGRSREGPGGISGSSQKWGSSALPQMWHSSLRRRREADPSTLRALTLDTKPGAVTSLAA